MESESESWETVSSSSHSSLDSLHDIPKPLPLLPVPADVSRPDNELCSTCKQLKLNPRRFVVLPGNKEWNKLNQTDKPSIPFGNVTDIIVRKESCPLCRLVLEALGGDRVPKSEEDEPVHVELSWSTNGPKPDPQAPWNHIPEIRMLVPYASKLTGGYIKSINLFPEITLLANDSPIPSTSYFIRPILEDRIDFDLVRRWLSICSTKHKNACRKNPFITDHESHHPADPDAVPDFRCIDVDQNCLVEPPSGSRYTALSYVWGSKSFFTTTAENIGELKEPKSLGKAEILNQLPQTIKDAMQVTREVGVQYLWVDSLCIVQNDEENKENKLKAIKMMDLVYSAAYLVIIAAGSTDAFAGIAGVRPGTRGRRQPIEEIAPGFRLAFNTRWQHFLKDAVYDKRGWTYQEMHFATRSLIFIGGQVVFRCQASEWQEHTFETKAEIIGEGRMSQRGLDDIGEFEGHIQSYSERKLSKNSDIYNAFAGIAKEITLKLKTDLCHGVPTAYFDWFLLWSPLANQVRRPNAPSWSWAGWEGGSFPRIWDWYNRSIRRIEKAIQKRTWVIWYHRLDHETSSCVLVYKHDPRRLMRLTSEKKRKFRNLDCSRTEPSLRTLKKDTPEYEIDILSKQPGSGFLQFWTIALSLRLDIPTSNADDFGKLHSRHLLRGNQRALGIFGRSGNELGTVAVKKTWIEKNPVPVEREFILLCEGRDERAKDGRIDDKEGWRYMAMLIDWHEGYAERVAVGSIGKKDLKEALGGGAVWKEFILG